MIHKILEWFASFRKLQAPDLVDYVSEQCLILIRHYESMRLDAYIDAVGVVTIGYGDTGPHVNMGDTITTEEAEKRLRRRLDGEFVPGVLMAIHSLPKQNELDAMASLAYNIGVGAFSGSTLVKKYNAGDKQGAANEFVRWDKAGGKALKGLQRRRHAERYVFLGWPAHQAIEQSLRDFP